MLLHVHKSDYVYKEISCVVGTDRLFIFRSNKILEICDRNGGIIKKIDLNGKIGGCVSKCVSHDNNLYIQTNNDVYQYTIDKLKIKKINNVIGLISHELFYSRNEIINNSNKIVKRYKNSINMIRIIDDMIIVGLTDSSISILDQQYKTVHELELDGLLVDVMKYGNDIIITDNRSNMYLIRSGIIFDKILIDKYDKNVHGKLILINNHILVSNGIKYQVYDVNNDRLVFKCAQTTHCDLINGFINFMGCIYSFGNDGMLVQIDLNEKCEIKVRRCFDRRIIRSSENRWCTADGNEISIYGLRDDKTECKDLSPIKNENSSVLSALKEFKPKEPENNFLIHVLKYNATKIVLDCDISRNSGAFCYTTAKETKLYKIKSDDSIELIKTFDSGYESVRLVGDHYCILINKSISIFDYADKYDFIPCSIKKHNNLYVLNNDMIITGNKIIKLGGDEKKINGSVMDAKNNSILVERDNKMYLDTIDGKSTEILCNKYTRPSVLINDQYVANDRYLIKVDGDQNKYDIGAVIESGFEINNQLVLVQSNWDGYMRKMKSVNYREKFKNK